VFLLAKRRTSLADKNYILFSPVQTTAGYLPRLMASQGGVSLLYIFKIYEIKIAPPFGGATIVAL